jgi:hypothetical protein
LKHKKLTVLLVPFLLINILHTADIRGDQSWYGQGQIGHGIGLQVFLGEHSTSFWLHWYFNSSDPLINVTVTFIVYLGGGFHGEDSMGSGLAEASGDYYYDSPSFTEYNFSVVFEQSDFYHENDTWVEAVITKSLISPGGTNGLSISIISLTASFLIAIPLFYLVRRKSK